MAACLGDGSLAALWLARDAPRSQNASAMHVAHFEAFSNAFRMLPVDGRPAQHDHGGT
eukprot:CAMPEP_0206456706 /NCGR_PEP_ID=MMETSP0324_2-20121206/22530_1 /ASSEMBLY_ACC=CAM_ASM_000836 /TAXON_ID=2866 /ORGANISM="Crypthecodinium cohnii, Strain Seligo" /LENGTH=57 /DNA_ID=CAMNT_0053927697 /DNA_START=133 /DNA_END=303 /DNA_ORIENTATION=-